MAFSDGEESAENERAEEEREDDDDDEDEPKPTRSPRRSTPRRPTRKRIRSYEESDPEDVETDEDDIIENVEVRKPLIEEDLTCPHCKRVFVTDFGLKYHIDKAVCRRDDTKGNAVKEEAEDQTCPLCKKTFGSSYGYKYHMEKAVCQKDDSERKPKPAPKKETEKKQYICPHCSHEFKNKSGYKYHVDNAVCRKDEAEEKAKKEARKKQYVCHHCNRGFRNITGYQNHVDNEVCLKAEADTKEEEEKEYRCSRCKKEFSNSFGYKYHVDKDVCLRAETKKKVKEERDKEEKKRAKRKAEQLAKGVEAEGDENEKKRSRAEDEPARANSTDKPNLTCEHCNKTFAISRGLEYHLEHKVCQKDDSGKKKFKRPPKDRASGQQYKRFRGPQDERTCPHCNRVFTSSLGKDYHVANRVCQQQGKKKDARALPFDIVDSGAEFVTKYGVVRVVQDSRAMPKGELPEDADRKHKLWKSNTKRLQIKRKEHHITVSMHSLARRKRLNNLYDASQSASKEISKETWQAYFGTKNLRNPFEGGGHHNFPGVGSGSPDGPHPMEPEESHAGRIVECVLIPDERRLVECETLDTHREGRKAEEFVQTLKDLPDYSHWKNIPIFMQRRQLTQQYNQTGSRFQCKDCGREFTSIVGCKYHVTAKACYNKAGRRQIDKYRTPEQRRALLDKRAENLVESQARLMRDVERMPTLRINAMSTAGPALQRASGEAARDVAPNLEAHQILEREREGRHTKATVPRNEKGKYAKRKWKSKRKKDLAYYPQVWRSLGFKVVPVTPRAPAVSSWKPKKRGDIVYSNAQLTQKIDDGEHLAETLKSLQDELIELQSAQLGAYYPSVWKVLRFRKPGPARKEEEEEQEEESSEDEIVPVGKIRATAPAPFVPQPPPFPYGPAVIVDISVLAGEIDAGRYPSMKRIQTTTEEGSDAEDRHSDFCYMCKDSRGLLYLCDFCTNVNHLACIRTRFIIKDPEPNDDFMCNKCIQCLMQRRRRAEKRRMKSLGGGSAEERPGKRGPYGDSTTKKVEPETPLLRKDAADVEPGQEFDFLAAHEQHVGDIVGLLKDSYARLQQLVETAKINDFRRNIFE